MDREFHLNGYNNQVTMRLFGTRPERKRGTETPELEG
jgi:hypothetical protein